MAAGEGGLSVAFEKLMHGFVGLAAHRCLPPLTRGPSELPLSFY